MLDADLTQIPVSKGWPGQCLLAETHQNAPEDGYGPSGTVRGLGGYGGFGALASESWEAGPGLGCVGDVTGGPSEAAASSGVGRDDGDAGGAAGGGGDDGVGDSGDQSRPWDTFPDTGWAWQAAGAPEAGPQDLFRDSDYVSREW